MEQIIIETRVIDEATGTIKKIIRPMIKLQEALKITRLTMKQLNKYAQENFLAVNEEAGIVIDKLTGRIVDNAQVVKRATIQTRRFKFEWLSIMFAGFALDRVFGSLIRRQMELFGVTKMMSAAWTTVLLPVMEAITPFLYKFIELFMNLPQPLKIAIGSFVLLGAVLGKILATVGQVVLAFMGFKMLGIPIGIVKTALISLASFIVPIGSAVWGLIDIFRNWGKSTKNVIGGIIKVLAGLGGIIAIMMGAPALLVAAIVGAVVLITHFIIKKWDLIKKVTLNLWNSVKNFFINMFNSIKSVFIAVWEWIKSLPYKILNVFLGLGRKIKNILLNMIPFGGTIRRILGFQGGGLVPYTGLFYLHAGERVIPRGRTSSQIIFSPNVTIYSSINSDYDVRKLASELNRYWAADFERLIKSRGSI